MTHINLSMKQKQNRGHREQTGGWDGGGGMHWDFGVSRCKLVYTERINNKVLLQSTGNYSQYTGINHNGREYIYV